MTCLYYCNSDTKNFLLSFIQITPLFFKYAMALKDGQDTTAQKAEITEKLSKLEEVRAFHSSEQVGSYIVSPYIPLSRLWYLELDLFLFCW